MSTPFSVAYARFWRADLSRYVLTADEKTQLGRDINAKKVKISELQKRFNLPERRLQIYAKAMRKGRPLRDSGGKPTKLDSRARTRSKPSWWKSGRATTPLRRLKSATKSRKALPLRADAAGALT